MTTKINGKIHEYFEDTFVWANEEIIHEENTEYPMEWVTVNDCEYAVDEPWEMLVDDMGDGVTIEVSCGVIRVNNNGHIAYALMPELL